mgnify:CR=1 FL=1
MTMQKIRTATFEDLDAIAAVEAACFPAAEAATKEEFAGRLTHYADHFWLLFEDEKLVSFVDGFVTDTPDLTDEMYADASLHDAHGAWQMIFGVNTLPEYRKQGLAGQLLRRASRRCKGSGPQGAGAHLQGQARALLRRLRLCQRRRFRLHPRRRGVVPDAADLLNFLQKAAPPPAGNTGERGRFAFAGRIWSTCTTGQTLRLCT